MVVAVDKDLNVVLKKEYRHTIGENLIELPAGTFEDGEFNSLGAAKRELLEETGYVSDEWINLGKTVESPSKSNTECTIYLAKKSYRAFEQQPDSTEDIDLLIVPLREAFKMCMNNTIRVNNSVNGILKAAILLNICE